MASSPWPSPPKEERGNVCQFLLAWMCFLVSALAAESISATVTPYKLEAAAISDHTLCLTLESGTGSAKTVSAPSPYLLPQQARERQIWMSTESSRTLQTGPWRVKVQGMPLTIEVATTDGRVIQKLALETQSGALAFAPGNGPLLGLGEGGRQFDRRGGYYRMRPGWSMGILGSTVPSPLLIGTDGWALFIPQPNGEFDLRGQPGRFLPTTSSGSQPLRCYVIAWNDPATLCEEYIRLTGRPVLPPKWALGYMQSHRTLAGPEEVLQVARTMRDKKLPCDTLIYLGTGYCPAGWNLGHGSLDFNPKTFDHPADNIRQLHDLNFKVVLHINHAPRDLFGASINETSDLPVHIHNYWARHLSTLALGVDGWWPDDGDELPDTARIIRHQVYYDGPLANRPGVRPWSLHRTGTPGVARYGGWIWSGDVDSRWDTLAAQVSVGLNHSLSLTPFWGSDTGGFVPKKELTGELYVRWFQFSAFCPSFRSHGRTWHLRLPWGWNTGEWGPIESPERPDASELHNAEVEPICRKFLNLRYQLLPYNYTLAREAHDTGLPLMRPLWLHYRGDRTATARGDEYLWGRDLLVAPVVAKGAQERELYLPAGEWYDWWTGEKFNGGRTLRRPVKLADLPLYARAGSIIPLDPIRQFTGESVNEPTVLRIFTGADGQFTLYDDDGGSLDYEAGKCVWLRLIWNNNQRQLVMLPRAERAFEAMARRNFKIQLWPSGTEKDMEYKGERITVLF